ncbi:MAG: hypothetical protein OXR68_03645, partial [Alphaproteobacteria bacterium]|nr:hypothetical protein [Alphaproteobacteria bacterium]
FNRIYNSDKKIRLNKKSFNILVVKEYKRSDKTIKEYLPFKQVLPITYVGYLSKISDEMVYV